MTHEAIIEHLRGCLLPDWETLPDFGLYKDQMISFVSRSLPGVSGRLDLTASMINNYVKAGLIEKPAGKKYSREALAQLLMVVQLKLTTPMEMVKTLLHPEDGTETRELYAQFRAYQDQVIAEYGKQEAAPRLMYALKSSSLQLMMLLSGEEAVPEAEAPASAPRAREGKRGTEGAVKNKKRPGNDEDLH
jgi:DNA-binding transcriptional MerR regulator